MKLTIEELRKRDWIVYEYIRGSHSHGTATETSDIDIGGVFIIPYDCLLSTRDEYVEQVSDEKNDVVYYELGRWIELLIKSNPTMLESLYIPDNCVRIKKPIIQEILDNRDKFLSKEAITIFKKYGVSQAKKAMGYKKLCSYPDDMERKQPLDYCYTYDGRQGSMPISDFLSNLGLKQTYCSVNCFQNMPYMHGVFYDIAEHIHLEYANSEEFREACKKGELSEYAIKLIQDEVSHDIIDCDIVANEHNPKYFELVYSKLIPKGYRGIVNRDGTSNEIRIDWVKKGDKPICMLSYNVDGYQSHCRQYKEWSDWKKKRNKIRYESNFGTSYDSKNMSEVIRLLTMASEVAENKGFVCDRNLVGQRELLLDIKAHKYTYDEIVKMSTDLEKRIEDALPNCKLNEFVDKEWANNLLIKLRKDAYNKVLL